MQKTYKVDFLIYDEQLVRRLIGKVTVFYDKIIIEFKSGVAIEVE